MAQHPSVSKSPADASHVGKGCAEGVHSDGHGALQKLSGCCESIHACSIVVASCGQVAYAERAKAKTKTNASILFCSDKKLL